MSEGRGTPRRSFCVRYFGCGADGGWSVVCFSFFFLFESSSEERILTLRTKDPGPSPPFSLLAPSRLAQTHRAPPPPPPIHPFITKFPGARLLPPPPPAPAPPRPPGPCAGGTRRGAEARGSEGPALLAGSEADGTKQTKREGRGGAFRADPGREAQPGPATRARPRAAKGG